MHVDGTQAALQAGGAGAGGLNDPRFISFPNITNPLLGSTDYSKEGLLSSQAAEQDAAVAARGKDADPNSVTLAKHFCTSDQWLQLQSIFSSVHSEQEAN